MTFAIWFITGRSTGFGDELAKPVAPSPSPQARRH